MDEQLVEAVTKRVCQMMQNAPRQALLIGNPPAQDLGWRYVSEPPYSAVVIGSMTLGELLYFRQEEALLALAQGMPVYLYEGGLPAPSCKSRALAARLSAARRELKAMGVAFVSGGAKPGFISAAEARRLKAEGLAPPAGSLLSPLAKDILEGKSQ